MRNRDYEQIKKIFSKSSELLAYFLFYKCIKV